MTGKGNFGKNPKSNNKDKKVEEAQKPLADMTTEELHAQVTSIDSDSDFDKYNLWDMEFDKLDALPDNRKSGFWKLTWTQVILRVLLWLCVVYVNQQGWLDPWDPRCVYAEYKSKRVNWFFDWFFMEDRWYHSFFVADWAVTTKGE